MMNKNEQLDMSIDILRQQIIDSRAAGNTVAVEQFTLLLKTAEGRRKSAQKARQKFPKR